MEGAFTLAEPILDWGTIAGVHRLIWLGMLSILGKVKLGALGVSPLPVTLQRAVVMLQLDIFGMEMFPFEGTPAGGMVLSVMAVLGRHSRVWGEEEATGPDGRRSQLSS
ncbi:unnamed protein product [Prunus armeniaca]